MKISIKLIFLFFLLKSIVCNSDEYTKDIMQSSFITFNEKNYNKITFQNEIENTEISKKLLFIYTPGSLNDDRMDGICSTYNEFAYLSEIFHKLKNNFDYYFYLNCTNNIQGDMKIPNASNFPFPYQGISKHEKIRKSLKNLIDKFKNNGFKTENIFLIGHSCGAWHSLYLVSQNKDLVNSIIAFSPSCYGPRYLYFQRRGFLKHRKQDIKKISNSLSIPSLIFISPDDIRENHMTLKWLKKIKGVKIIKTIKKKNKEYYFENNLCVFHADDNIKEFSILDGHNLHFSKCFNKYNDDIYNFIKLRVG